MQTYMWVSRRYKYLVTLNVPHDTVRSAIYWTGVNKAQNQTVCRPKSMGLATSSLICFFSIWWKEEHQSIITYHKLIELFLVDFSINVRKNCHFWRCSLSHFFVGICDIYQENSLLNFSFCFDIEKTIPVYIPTLLVMSFI